VGLAYVSCSPFRVPVARLAAAKAAVELGTSPKGGKKAKASKPAKPGKAAKSAKPAKAGKAKKGKGGKRK
jgi:pyruvate,orthophosphate dikinase